jgi:integrating conjugative element protein (TIGR03758 family)
VRTLNRRIAYAVALFLGLQIACLAGGTYNDYLAALRQFESGNRPGIVNRFGYAGLYQMGESALASAGYYVSDATPNVNDWSGTWTGKNGVASLRDFLSDPAKQTQAVDDYNRAQWNAITILGLNRYLGQTIGGVAITESGLLAGAHLVGVGALQRFLASNGRTVPQDGNHTLITTYISAFGGFSVGPIAATGFVAPGAGPGLAPSTSGGSATNTPLAPIATISVSPAAAFAAASGRSPADVKLIVAMFVAVLSFLWVVWCSARHFNLWRKGRLETFAFQSDLLRAVVVMSILVAIVQ